MDTGDVVRNRNESNESIDVEVSAVVVGNRIVVTKRPKNVPGPLTAHLPLVTIRVHQIP